MPTSQTGSSVSKRSERRAQRERAVKRRIRQMAAVGSKSRQPGRYAKHSPLGCPGGRKCGVCHPGKAPHEPTRQEIAIDDEWGAFVRASVQTSLAFLADEPDLYGTIDP